MFIYTSNALCTKMCAYLSTGWPKKIVLKSVSEIRFIH